MRNPIVNTDHYDLNREEYGSRRWSMGVWKGVVAENRDPAGLGRLKVRLPQLHGDEFLIPDDSLPWSYPIVLDPGAGTGSFDIPDKGTKVWVQFEQGDLNHPVWFGGWVTQNSGPPPTSNPVAAPVKDAASKVSGATKNISDATAKANDAGQKASKAAGSVSTAAGNLQSTASKAAQAVASLASNPTAPSQSDLDNAKSVLSSAQSNHDSIVSTATKVSETSSDVTGSVAEVQQSLQQSVSDLGAAKSSLASSVNSALPSSDVSIQVTVDAGKSVLPNISTATDHATAVSNSAGALSASMSSVEQASLSLVSHSASVVSTLKTAIDVATGGFSSLSALAAQLGTLQNLATNIVNNIQDAVSSISSVLSQVESIFTSSKALSATSKALSALSKASEAQVTGAINKLVGKKNPDPSVAPPRPENFNDKAWPLGPGSEIPHESQNMFNNVPSVRVWKKSSKGHTMMCEDQDAKESMTHIDRAGNALYFHCPVDPTYNERNMMFRGQKSTLTNDAIDRIFMRDKGSQVGLQDQAQSKIELDSRMNASKITIVANDGDGGIENGTDRQKMELMADARCIIVESVKDGEVNAKVHIDANSGMVVVEAARFVNLHAPYVSISADHINLNGRVNVAGDMTVSGRLTGGNK